MEVDLDGAFLEVPYGVMHEVYTVNMQKQYITLLKTQEKVTNVC